VRKFNYRAKGFSKTGGRGVRPIGVNKRAEVMDIREFAFAKSTRESGNEGTVKNNFREVFRAKSTELTVMNFIDDNHVWVEG
jgi:hypothetical protein